MTTSNSTSLATPAEAPDARVGSGDWLASGRLATPHERAENERALARLFKLFPRLPKRDCVEFLISNTAFPFNSLTDAVEQAADLSRRAHKSVERAYIESDRQMSRAMRHYHRNNPDAENDLPNK